MTKYKQFIRYLTFLVEWAPVFYRVAKSWDFVWQPVLLVIEYRYFVRYLCIGNYLELIRSDYVYFCGIWLGNCFYVTNTGIPLSG